MARYKITLSQSSWTGGTAAFWFDPADGDNGTAYDAETGGNAITSITVPTRSSYTFLGFGLTNPYYRCVDEHGNIVATKVKETLNPSSTAVTGSLQPKTFSIFQAQTSTISGATATIRTITITSTYWKGAPAKIYYNPAVDKFYLDSAQTEEVSAAVTAGRECWTYSGCYAGNGPQYVSSAPAKSGDQYVDSSGAILYELRIRAKAQTSFTINPRGAYYSFKIVLDANGGSVGDDGVSAIYRPVSTTGTYYTDYLCAAGTEISALSAAQLPAMAAKVFGGCTGTKVTTASGAASATYYADKDGVLNIANLDALPLSVSGSVALVKATVYARWVGVCTVTVNKGTYGTNANLPLGTFYADTVNGTFYADQGMAEQIGNIGSPTNECYAFMGCFNATAGTVEYVDAVGNITESLSIAEYTTSLTIYCKWAQTSWRLSLGRNGGTDGPNAIYCSVSSGDWFEDPLAEAGSASSISVITPPFRIGYIFIGYHKSNSSSSDVLVERDGTLNTANLATVTPSGSTPPSANAYAMWQQLKAVNIGLNATSSTVGQMNVDTAQAGDYQIYYGVEDQNYYADDSAEEVVGTSTRPIVLPSVRCSRCTGIFNSPSNGAQKFDGAGLAVEGASAPTSSTQTWYAQWERKCYVAELDDNGGTGGSGAVFYDGDTNTLYSGDDFTSTTPPMTSVTPPTREGYTFVGYYTSKTGGALLIESDGSIAVVSGFGNRDTTLYAHWKANLYTLSFPDGIEHSNAVTYGSAIGSMPTPPSALIPPRARFRSWAIDGIGVSSTTKWRWAEDKTATMLLEYAFGDVVDYFGLGSPALIPFESESGENRPHVVTRHYGKAQGASQTGPVWRNPTVRYMVVGNTTFNVTLGAAFGGGSSTTGYMITSASIETDFGKFPIVTVSAVATEGRDAINLFTISVPLLARARAQNMLGAVFGGGELHRMTLKATCDPVVLQEGLAPCASDAVNGRFEMRAETLAMNFEGAPAAAGGFTSIGAPVAKSATNYTRYRISARKEIF